MSELPVSCPLAKLQKVTGAKGTARINAYSCLAHLLAMDWSKVRLPEGKATRVQASEVAELDFSKLYVASKLIKKSMSAMLQTAVYTYIGRCWPAHEERLIAKAAQLGLEPEELFSKIANDEIEV